MNTVNIFNCDVSTLTMRETVQEIKERIEEKVTTQHVVINAGKVVLMEKSERLQNIVRSCPIINADGQSIVWASKLLGKPIPERVTGIDLMQELLKLADENGYRVYFFGAKQEIITKLVIKLKEQFSNLNIAGYRNGYFNKEDEPEIIEDMKKSKADILFVGFSSPKKEYWLDENIDKINIPFCMGVGGSFDVIVGKTKRAPKWMQKLGLEWFYRFIQEPKRMWKRYLLGNLKFLCITLKEKLR